MTDSHLEKTAIEAMCANALDTSFEDFDNQTTEQTKSRIIDMIGCSIGGARAPGTAELVNLVKRWGGKDEATIIVHGGKAPAHNVAMLNSVMARSFDFEVCCIPFKGQIVPSHSSVTTIPTAMTLGETRQISGKELIASVVVGDDICARIILASDFDFNLGWDNTGTVPIFGAAAIAGRLLGLNALQLRDAFGILLNQVSGTMQGIMDGTPVFKLNMATAARNGIIAAEMAQAGWTGAQDALYSRFGYFKLFTHGIDHPEILTEGLGKAYYTEGVFKPYPGGRPTHTSIDAALALIHKHQIIIDDIEEIELGLSPKASYFHYMKPFRMGRYPNGDALFSYQYSIASALVVKSVTQANFTEESIHDSRVQALIPKIKMAKISKDEGIELRILMKSGRAFSQYLREATGEPPHNQLTREEIKNKFMTQIKYSRTISTSKAEKLLRQLEKLEEVANISSIIECLVI
jgi:2-methylcitrate dehydratase PrpD